jgi:hypothetical protein
MRGNLATVFKEKHCYTCHSTEAMGVCVYCGVATYCDAQCAQVGWSDHGHAATCGSYSRLVSAVTMASSSTPLGWPTYLESDEKRDGFDRFVRERSPALGIYDVIESPPVYKINLLLENIWITLTEDMQRKWARKAEERGYGAAIDAFTDERKSFIIKDITEERSYPNDTLLKQIWRNLIKSERQYFVGGVQNPEASIPESTGEREHKRRRLAIDVVNNYLTDHRDGLPTEMIMAIINHLSLEDIADTASVDKRLNAVVWQLLYMIDIAPIINSKLASNALFEALSNALSIDRVDFKKRYMAAGHMLSNAMATVVIGDMTDADADASDPPSTRLFLITDAPNGKPLFEGRTLSKFPAPIHKLKSMYVGRNIDKFDVRYISHIAWYEDMIPDNTEGEKRLIAGRKAIAGGLKRYTKWHEGRNISFLLYNEMGHDFAKYYGYPYWSNGIIFKPSNDTVRTSSLAPSYTIMDKATRTRRFGWDKTAANRTTAVLHKALEAFFFDMFMHRNTTMTLTTVYVQSVGPDYDGDDDAEQGTLDDYQEDDEIPDGKRVVRKTMVSLLTGTHEVDAGVISALEMEKFHRILYPYSKWDDSWREVSLYSMDRI